MSNQFATFLTKDALKINQARQDHLATLKLSLAGKRVLEVGAGIGLHTQFFEALGCTVLTTDGRPENVAEIRRRYPHRQAQVLDLDESSDLSYLGTFDIIYCYGTLYHLLKPEQALQAMAQVCKEMILLETCVTPGDDLAINLVDEDNTNYNQARSGIGCRPTRPWVMAMLKQYFGFAYISRDQPCYPDFDLNWLSSLPKKLHRAIFIGSKAVLINDKLLEVLPQQQGYDPDQQKIWSEELLSSSDCHQQIWDLEPEVVLRLAEAIAVIRPLQPYPGWRFNIEWDSADRKSQLRQTIWEYFKSQTVRGKNSISVASRSSSFSTSR